MEWLIIFTGINEDEEIEEIVTKIITTQDLEEANIKAYEYLQNINDLELSWDIQQITRLDMIERV